jgi:hypothetical protein
MVSILYAVALVTCTDICTMQVLTDEVYTRKQDCEDRAVHLAKINPGKEFDCGLVYRRKDK